MTIEASRLGLCLRDGAAARDPQSRKPDGQSGLRHRRGAARLYRAHQHPRQYPHARLCDPPRIRYLGRRCLQSRAGQSRRAAPEESVLLQERADHDRARLGARSRHPQRRARGAVDRRILRLRRLSRRPTASWREVSIAERNLLGRGLYAKASVQYGQYAKGFTVSFVEPYFLGYRVALGLDIFAKQQSSTSYVVVSVEHRRLLDPARIRIARGSRLPGPLFALSAVDLAAAQYELQQSVFSYLPDAWINGGTGVLPNDRLLLSTAKRRSRSRKELAQGAVFTSAIGYSLTYNTLDNNKNPTMGTLATFNQDFAGVGGDVNYIKTTTDAAQLSRSRSGRHRRPASAGRLRDRLGRPGSAHARPFPDGAEPGSRLRAVRHRAARPVAVPVHGHAGRCARRHRCTGAPASSSRRRSTSCRRIPASASPPSRMPARCGTMSDRRPGRSPASGSTARSTVRPGARRSNPVPCPVDNGMYVRSSVGVGLIWDSPFGPLRFDYSFPLTKAALRPGAAIPLRRRNFVLISAAQPRYKVA